MFRRSISSLISIFVVAVIATEYSDSASITVADTEVTDYRLGGENLESPTTERVQEGTEAAAVDLGDLLDAEEAAMVTLVAGDTRLLVHRAVLEARSHVFAAALHSNTLEAGGSGHIAIPDVEGPVLRQLVAYLYTLQARQLPSMAPELLIAADKYGVPALREECEQHMVAHLSVENAAAVAVFAVRHSYTTLRQATVAFIRDHLVHVMATQAWADAMQNYTKELIQVSQMLSESPAENGAPASSEGGPTATPTPLSDVSHCDRTRLTAAPTKAAPRTLPTPIASVSLMRRLSSERLGKWLIEAVKEGTVEEVRALLAAGADLEQTDEGAGEGDRYTALHWAAWEGDVEVVRSLLEAGADASVRSVQRYTPLQVAAWRGNTAVVRLLLALCVDPNTTNKWGWTPLHEVASHGHTETAAVLLEAGANRAATNNRRQTPLDIARERHFNKLINMLKFN